MKAKTPLMLMEQLVMLLVFALAAGLCLQVFVFAHQTSRRHALRDRAVLEAQNAAEAVKGGARTYFSAMGDEESADGGYVLLYDKNWQPVRENAAYLLTVTPLESGTAFLWQAEIAVRTAEGEELFVLPVAVQTGKEVSSG